MATNSLPQTVNFESTTMSVVDRDGVPWLTSSDLAKALKYVDSGNINKIYDRNSDEFTEEMTIKVNLAFTDKTPNLVRIFSPRGCHLIAMLSKTAKAKAFRKWVLDVLETSAAPTAEMIVANSDDHLKTLANYSSLAMFNNVKGLVLDKAEDLTAVTGSLAIDVTAIRRQFTDIEQRLLLAVEQLAQKLHDDQQAQLETVVKGVVDRTVKSTLKQQHREAEAMRRESYDAAAVARTLELLDNNPDVAQQAAGLLRDNVEGSPVQRVIDRRMVGHG